MKRPERVCGYSRIEQYFVKRKKYIKVVCSEKIFPSIFLTFNRKPTHTSLYPIIIAIKINKNVKSRQVLRIMLILSLVSKDRNGQVT